jgi:phosphoglycolate phosphatase-like HAD superfamily hydrolase
MVTITIPGHSFDNIDLVIFDKDGTLMELHHYWSEMCILRSDMISEKLKLTVDERKQLLYAMGVDLDQKKLRAEGPVGIKKREIVMQAAIDYLSSIGHRDSRDLCNQVFNDVDAFSTRILDQLVIPIHGAPELINSLVRAGGKIAVATTDRSNRALLAMRILGFDGKIDFIIGSDSVSESKPDPEMVNLILQHLNVKQINALMVGDASTDIQMGVNAGLRGSIGVLTGLTRESELRTLTPYIINSIADMSVTDER